MVGCSAGGVTPSARKGAIVHGIDIADEAIKRLQAAIERENLSHIAKATLMDAEDLTLQDKSFDVICCTGVLHHLDIDKAAASWSRKLKPEGSVYMCSSRSRSTQ